MQIVRTVIWVLLLVVLVIFAIFNWTPVEVMIWPFAEEGRRLLWVTNIAAIVIVAFLIGLVPMWLYHRASKWALNRKIANLENAARTAAATPVTTGAEPEPAPAPAPPPPEPVVEEPESELSPPEDTSSTGPKPGL